MVNYENDYIWGEKQQRRIFPILKKEWKALRNKVDGINTMP
jgi:hypothetical protein